MGLAFQANAFQDGYPSFLAAFQSFDRYVQVDLVSVLPFLIIDIGPVMLDYKAGDLVIINARVKDPSQVPPVPFDPDTVEINILDPAQVLVVTLGAMSQLSTGLYTYPYQTSSGDDLGVYSVNIKATSGGNIAQTITQGAFRLT